MKRYGIHGFSRQMGHLFSSKSSWTPKTQPNNSRAVVWLSFWCSTRPSADTVTNQDRAHYHQLAIFMLKSSWYDDFTIGERLWKTHYDMKTSTWQSPTDDNMLGLKLVTVSAEGRVEHQKLNQTTALLLFGWVFGVQLGSLEKKGLA